jgi:hypothetical protein
VWRVLERLSDRFDVVGPWIGNPSVGYIQELTARILQSPKYSQGIAPLAAFTWVVADWSDVDRAREDWAGFCGFPVEGPWAVVRTTPMQDYAAAILAIAGRPMSTAQLTEHFEVHRSPKSLSYRLSHDPRFRRVDRSIWALASWDLEEYSTIRDKIREHLDQAGGSVDLEELIQALTSHFSISPGSIRTYASTPPFQSSGGRVTYSNRSRLGTKPPERTRRLFRIDGGWAYHIHITADHIRGSSSVAPVAVASLAGLKAGQTLQLPSRLGPQSMGWTGVRPAFGTLRRFVLSEGLSVGDEALLIITDNSEFDFRPLPPRTRTWSARSPPGSGRTP